MGWEGRGDGIRRRGRVCGGVRKWVVWRGKGERVGEGRGSRIVARREEEQVAIKGRERDGRWREGRGER